MNTEDAKTPKQQFIEALGGQHEPAENGDIKKALDARTAEKHRNSQDEAAETSYNEYCRRCRESEARAQFTQWLWDCMYDQ